MTSRIVFNCASTDRMSALVSLTTSVAVTLHAAPSAVAAKKGNGSESIVLNNAAQLWPVYDKNTHRHHAQRARRDVVQQVHGRDGNARLLQKALRKCLACREADHVGNEDEETHIGEAHFSHASDERTEAYDQDG
eukprot:CAMPEP_0198708310 /NCGR_PEP_ID=MMETSP1471-20131121/1005_1 /TAXON_ID=41880 /ORGANISM="Pycnococcus provasolii, Strain RCC733" /LENGTH=134 /DNA_ID=CAMNT_0044467539 /DNA_START=192 /DNA_END=595 /DNA_ORIENTATION=-